MLENQGLVLSQSGNCDCKKQIFATHDRYYISPAQTVWTLLSKIENPHTDAASYNNTFTYIGNNISGTHPSGPDQGSAIDGWNIYSIISATQPQNDSNGHYWILGQPDSFGTFTFDRINLNLISGSGECISIQEIKEKDSCTGEETYRYVTENGLGLLVDITSVILNFDEDNIELECPIKDCWEPTSICKCYGGGTTTIYQDTDNSTDLDFSSNTTTIKWNSSGGDGSDVFTQAIRNCITGGNVAQLSITTFDNIVYLFNADAILSDAGASGIGSYVFTGTTNVGGSGKIMHAELICGTGETGTACLFTNCNDEQEWRDVTTPNVDNGTPYTIINPDSLIDCPTECTLTETIELISCAAETTSEANIGDYVLTIATVCVDTRIVLGQSMYNISNSNSPILEPLLTDSCDPTPQIQEIQNCIKDTNGVKWTQIAIVLTTVPPTVVSTLYYNQSTPVLGTPSGDSTKWTPCECNLTPECCHCFCAMTVPIKVRTEKELVAAKKAEASTTKPVKVTICSTNWRDCDLKVVKTTYTIDGKDVPAETFAKLKYTKTVCTDPIPTYTPGTPTCATYNDPVYGTIVLNVTIFTNDINPVDTFTIYNLADNYPGLGNIGDVYLPADELLVTACNCSPLPECITTTEECYEALSDVKGVANQGETITVKITHNAVTNTDFYEITHSATSTLIYAGPDPVGDIGLDVGNTAIWVLAPCTPELPEVFDILEKEVCGTIDGSTDSYELIKVYTRDILTGISTILHYEDNFGNIITGTVTEVCCTCDTLCEIAAPIPLRNIRCQGYAANLDPNLSQSDWMLGYARYDQSYWDSVCGVGTVTGFTWELDSLIHNGTEYISTPIIITVPFSSMTFTPTGVPTEFATFFNTTLNTYGINLDPDMATKEYVNGATWLLAFRQYPNPIACSSGPINRLEVLTEYGDGFEFTSMLNPTLNDIQSYTMNLYNVGQGGTSLNGNNGCVTI